MQISISLGGKIPFDPNVIKLIYELKENDNGRINEGLKAHLPVCGAHDKSYRSDRDSDGLGTEEQK